MVYGINNGYGVLGPRNPTPNVVPFTYRDGTTFLEILNGLIGHLNSVIVPGLNAELESIRNEYQRLYDEMSAKLDVGLEEVRVSEEELRQWVHDVIQNINNTSAVAPVQFYELTPEDSVLAIDSRLPNQQVTYLHVNVSEGTSVVLDAGITGDTPVPGVDGQVFAAYPQPSDSNPQWIIRNLTATDPGSSIDVQIADIIEGATETRAIINALLSSVETSLRNYVVDYVADEVASVRADVPSLAADSMTTPGTDLWAAASARTEEAVTTGLGDPLSSIHAATEHLVREVEGDPFDPRLNSWRDALIGATPDPGIVVFAGGATVTEGNMDAVLRVAGFLTPRNSTNGAVVNLDNATTRPTSGAHVYRTGSRTATAAGYLTAGRVTGVGVLQPQVMVHVIGAEDFRLQTPIDLFKSQLKGWLDLIANVSANTTHVFVADIRNPAVPSSSILKWEQYVQVMRELAEEYEGVFYDMWMRHFRAMPTPPNMRDDTGLYLNEAGNRVVLDAFAKVLGLPLFPGAVENRRMPWIMAGETIQTDVITKVIEGVIPAAPYVRSLSVDLMLTAYGQAAAGSQGPEFGLGINYQDNEQVVTFTRVRMLNGGAGYALSTGSSPQALIEPNRAVRIYLDGHSINGAIHVFSASQFTRLEVQARPA